MADDPVNGLRLFDKRDGSHLATTCRTKQRVHLVNLADHLGPALGRHIVWLIFDDGGMGEPRGSLAHLPSVSIGVEAVVANHDLSLVRNMRGDSGYKPQIIHPFLL